MKLVNTVYRGVLKRLPENFEFRSREKLPRMKISKNNGVTLLVFNGLKFRIMGKLMRKDVMQLLPIETISLQTRTYTHKLCKSINLHHFNPPSQYEYLYEPELFNSFLLKLPRGGAINLFASGKVVLLGKLNLYTWRKHLRILQQHINCTTVSNKNCINAESSMKQV